MWYTLNEKFRVDKSACSNYFSSTFGKKRHSVEKGAGDSFTIPRLFLKKILKNILTYYQICGIIFFVSNSGNNSVLYKSAYSNHIYLIIKKDMVYSI